LKFLAFPILQINPGCFIFYISDLYLLFNYSKLFDLKSDLI